jgi:hypothetical protein
MHSRMAMLMSSRHRFCGCSKFRSGKSLSLSLRLFVVGYFLSSLPRETVRRSNEADVKKERDESHFLSSTTVTCLGGLFDGVSVCL